MSEDNFFSNIQQEDINFGKYTGKSPMFFKDTAVMGGVFLADYKELRNVCSFS